MSKIAWDESMSVGIDVIDQQHQSMVKEWTLHRGCCNEKSRCQ